MPTRFASRRERAFHWLPRDVTPANDIKISSVSVKTKIWSAEFTRAISPEIGYFKIILDNNNEEFSGSYTGGETVEFFVDYSDGDTKRFKGEIDTIKSKYDTSKGFTLELAGNHVSGELLNITVTESYSGDTTCDSILKELVDEYLTGYTYTNVETSTVSPTVNWNNKPFWECIEDLCRLAKSGTRFDCFVDDDKDIHFFEENSKDVPNTEAIVWNDTMISTEGLGTQTLTQKDKIIVYGESGELPIISTTGTGNKQEVLFDSKTTSIDMASELGAAEYTLKNRTETEGKANCFILADITPGYRIWITNPNFKINGQYKIYKYTTKLPLERTEVFVQTSREIPHIFKKRIENELALQTVTNPFKMDNTLISLTFDDPEEVTAMDTNVTIEDGIIKLSSGVEGTFTKTTTAGSDITSIHLQVKGSALVGTTYQFSTDGGETIKDITPETEISVESGTNIWLKVSLNSAETEIDALAVHGK